MQHLDLRGVPCPLNFVRVKLKLEEMEDKAVLQVILDDGEPIESVPNSLESEGHTVLSIDERLLDAGDAVKSWAVLVEK